MSKRIVITGAGSGLGKAIARRFAEGGDQVVLLGRTLSKIEAAAAEIGRGASAVQCDVTSPASVKQAFAEIGKGGAIDVLINNAAIFIPMLISEATDEQILEAVNTNYLGPILASRSALALMGRGGHIFNISSEAVHVNFPMFSLYQSSKAGLERFGEALQKEVEDDGIRVTNFRAGQMYDESASQSFDPELGMRFFKRCLEFGVNPQARPLSHFRSVADVIHMLAHLPADARITDVHLEARRP